jgi:hypothetical protein
MISASFGETGPGMRSSFDLRLVAAALLLVTAAVMTWLTMGALSQRRKMRVELAEISHVRYSLLNVDVWIEKLTPILEKKIDAFDLTASDKATLQPAVERALYGLLDDIGRQMGASPPAGAGGGLLSQANPLIVKMIVGALRPQVPHYAELAIAELTKSGNKEALKNYVKGALAAAAKSTFGNVDTRWYSSILKQHGCSSAASCREKLAGQIRQSDSQVAYYYILALAACAFGFILLLARRPALSRAAAVLLLLFCLTLLIGGVLTPMIEVEARLTQVGMTLMGEKVAFPDQVIYFQSKSVLEVFDALVKNGKPEMLVVAALVITFSIIFPVLKLLASCWCLFKPDLVHKSRAVHFFVLESSKWSMADVMALAILMAFVTFNGLITNTLGGVAGMALPTESSKILPGYYIFIGFCLASLFLSRRLAFDLGTAKRGEFGITAGK